MRQAWSRRAVLSQLGIAATSSTVGSAVVRSQKSSRTVNRWPISQRLGTTHVFPGYTFTERNVLNEGAIKLRELGSEVIKVWYHLVDEKYPQHSDWPSSFDSMVERAKHPYFRELFERPFETFILSAYSFGPGDGWNHYFRKGVSTAQYQQEVEEFYEFTKYLLETYRGTGKEFVLQHWQGDWAIIGSYDRSEEPTDEAVEGMIRWLNARQEGITRARQEVESDVSVLHAAEINIVLPAMEDGERRVINAVVPETDVDLVSHNSYAEMHRGYVAPNPNREGMPPTITPPEQVELMYRALDYVNEKTPEPSPYVQDALVTPEKNVFVGEYGFPARPKDQVDDAKRYSKLGTDVSLDWGARWVVYWQLYDGSSSNSGHWLIRPDGSKTPTYRYFRRLIEENRIPTPPEYVELEFEFDRLVDNRAFSCSKMEFRDRRSGTPKAYDIGTWMGEPIIWSGSFWTDEYEGRTSRWFGGNDGVTRIFVTRAAFDGARTLRLHGRPREAGIEATVRVNGQLVDSIRFSESRWRDWAVSLADETTTATTERDMTEMAANVSSTTTGQTSGRTTTTPASTTSPSTKSENVPGFGALAALAGLGTAAYRRYRSSRDEQN